MPISASASSQLAQILGSGTAGELIPQLVRQGLQALIEAEAAAEGTRPLPVSSVTFEHSHAPNPPPQIHPAL